MDSEEDGFDRYRRHVEELARIVTVKDGHIVVYVNYEYNIPISHCDTHAKILGWAHHLTEKTWMSTAILRYFIQVACRESGLALPNA